MRNRLWLLTLMVASVSGAGCWVIYGYRDGTWPTEVAMWGGWLAILSIDVIVFRLFWLLWRVWTEEITIELEADDGQ